MIVSPLPAWTGSGVVALDDGVPLTSDDPSFIAEGVRIESARPPAVVCFTFKVGENALNPERHAKSAEFHQRGSVAT